MFWIVSVPNVRVPDALFCNETAFVPPLPAEPLPIAVLPKFAFNDDPVTRIP